MSNNDKTIKTMDDLLQDAPLSNINSGDLIEGTIISAKKHEVWLDIGSLGVGLIPRRELLGGTDLVVGDKLQVSVVYPETQRGYALLSLRRVMKDRSWDKIQEIYDNNKIISVTSYDANRGGLLVEAEGVRGFLPISQLSTSHYPRISSGSFDKEEILNKLNQLVGKPLDVCILDLNREENKLIFSEKEALKESIAEQLKKLKVGDIVEGLITGVIDFGAFINVNGIEGLIHISEISWGRIEDPRKHIKIGEKLKVKVIAIDNDRVALSLKRMTEDPWGEEVANLSENSEVKGEITRVTPYGAFVRISPAVEALLYMMGNDGRNQNKKDQDESKASKAISKRPPAEVEALKKSLKVGDTHTFIIANINKESRRISLEPHPDMFANLKAISKKKES